MLFKLWIRILNTLSCAYKEANEMCSQFSLDVVPSPNVNVF